MLTHCVMRRLQNCLMVGVNCWDILSEFWFLSLDVSIGFSEVRMARVTLSL